MDKAQTHFEMVDLVDQIIKLKKSSAVVKL